MDEEEISEIIHANSQYLVTLLNYESFLKNVNEEEKKNSNYKLYWRDLL